MDLRDVRYNLLLRTDIDELLDSCLVDKVSKEICNNKVFWINKYENDGIPMLNYRDSLSMNIDMNKSVGKMQLI